MAGKDNKSNWKSRVIRQGKSTAESELALKQMRRQQIANMKKETASAVTPGAALNTSGLKKAMEKKRNNAVSSGAATGAAAVSKTPGERKVLVKATPKAKPDLRIQKMTEAPKSVSAAYERAFGKRKK